MFKRYKQTERGSRNEAAEQAALDASDLISSAQDLLRSTANYSGAEIDAARDKLKRQVDAAKEQSGYYRRRAAQRYRQASQAADEYVGDHKWETIGAVAALGAIIGACLASTRHKR